LMRATVFGVSTAGGEWRSDGRPEELVSGRLKPNAA
jgi:hypothetical protein